MTVPGAEQSASLVAGDQTLALLALMVGTVFFALWAETKKWGRTASAALIAMVVGMILSNIRIVPFGSELYGTISSLLVPVAIPMLLFRADLKRAFREVRPMFKAFVIAVVATVVGAFVAVLVMDLGEIEAKVAGVLAASYIGGGVNFVATAEAVEFNDSATYLAALSADAVGAVIFLSVLLLMPTVAFIRKMLPSKFIDQAGNTIEHHDSEADKEIDDEAAKPFSFSGLVLGLALSLGICTLGKLIASLLGMNNMFILIITVLALLLANFAKPIVDKVHHEFDIGTFFMYLFFATIGASANVMDVLDAALPMLIFIGIMVMVHVILLVFVGRLFKLDLAEAMIASNACILGPATAAAMAAGKGWRPLIVPGMLAGILGYSFATFIGVGITGVLS